MESNVHTPEYMSNSGGFLWQTVSDTADMQIEQCEPYSHERSPMTREEALSDDAVRDAVTLKTSPVAVIRTTPYRHLMIIMFAVFGFSNQLQYVAFTTIVREAEAYFNVNAIAVNVLSLLIPIIYVVGVVPGCYIYNHVGLRYGMIIGAGTNAFAGLLKLIAVWAPYYPLLVVAQIFVAIGQILYLSLPTLIAGIWFPPSERTVATAVASLMGFAGMAVGMFYSPHVVSLPDENTQKEWGGLMGSQFGLSMLILVVIGICARDKPKYNPSQTSTENYKLPLARFLKAQMRDKNFMLLTVSFGLSVGFLSSIAGMLTQLLEPFEISEEISGILAFSGILGGAMNCGVVGLCVDYTHRYKLTILILTAIMIVLVIIVTTILKVVKDFNAVAVALYILIPLVELTVLPIVPVVMELAVELAYPCPETVPTTLVLASMCFFSFVSMMIFSFILGDVPTTNSSFYCLLLTLCVSVASFIGFFFVQEKLCRHVEDDALDKAVAEEDERGDDDEGAKAANDGAEIHEKRMNVETGIAASPPDD
ncbi:hypothetical protein ABL78_1831 [Leptomonas seymouri]|uniref:Major facilitator superfamily (MFS) profile domain-containing protein n=1 Tax=Leptomonas seymouri TaxID=5684 RepID=A0A0N1ILZ7_LEPSE|nr:hypothetical protein ABL78_1831 [Leptomonas seymouri]|eukprot:KPI89095.1 hypothetical protein ABL78_1831 [Leptomonas seymouri]